MSRKQLGKEEKERVQEKRMACAKGLCQNQLWCLLGLQSTSVARAGRVKGSMVPVRAGEGGKKK